MSVSDIVKGGLRGLKPPIEVAVFCVFLIVFIRFFLQIFFITLQFSEIVFEIVK